MKRVVTIGGGTGSFNLLSGLKHYNLDITSVVTTFDSGGSTGVLRDEFGTLPGGDVRRAMIALAPEGDDQFLRELFQVRFESPDSGLHNHSFGNLLLLAAERVTKSRTEGIKELSKLLSLKGAVLPVSLDNANLCVFLADGREVRGEALIDQPDHDGSVSITKAWLEPRARIHDAAKEAIKKADVIIFGPGDLYTSIIANTLVEGFVDALKKSNAKTMLITNIMSKWGETHDMQAHQYVETLLSYLDRDTIDAVLVNERAISKDMEKRYLAQHKEMVQVDEGALQKYTNTIITDNFMSEADIARHNPEKTAKAVYEYIHATLGN